MKEITMFMFAGCPHCKRAKEMIEELCAENSEYAAVPLTAIDEKLDPETADKYDYYYVPTFFVDGEKIHEGVPTKEKIENVFKKACE
jgi:glutaredoxin